MKSISLTIFITAIILIFGNIARAQGGWTFVVIETAVSRVDVPTSDENPNERRFYVSDVVQYPSSIRSYHLNDVADTFFTESVVEPLKAKGIKLSYYSNDVKIECGSVLAISTKTEAEDARKQCVEDIKEQGDLTIYSFEWSFGKTSGLETAHPKLIFRTDGAPNYQPKGSTADKPSTTPNANAVTANKKKKIN